jgi:hypothetical protein
VFVAVLCAAWAGIESAVPEITDTDYHARLQILRSAANPPGRELGVVLGSSRMVFGFRPEQLPEDGGIYWVNGSHVAAGPILNRLIVHRMLRDGVRPGVLVLEVMPPFFVKENERTLTASFSADDWLFMRPYAEEPLDYDIHFLRHRVTRATDLARVTDPFAGYRVYGPRGGHTHVQEDVTDAERERRTAFAHRMYGQALKSMKVRSGAERAFRDTLRETREHGVRVVLLRSPEGPAFRNWYDPAGLARFDEFVSATAEEFSASVLDARLWLGEDAFYDSHHMVRRGADAFTARLAREVPVIPNR